jgi:deoxyadenosine/deoxycytidine kinase
MSAKQSTKKPKHIAIAGNIGAGKTTLTNLLCKHFDWTPHYEDTATNPYLSDFYEDMQRWSFNLQIFFLNSRYRQVLDIQNGDQTIIQDRTVYEDAFIFAPNLRDMGLMSERDFDNYFSLCETMRRNINPPDLLIYLKASIPTLVEHIHARGRDYEGSISLNYLKRLNERYDNWIDTYSDGKLLVINSDDFDFINNAEDLGHIVNQVSGELHGLFE